MSDHTEGFYFVRHYCGGDKCEESKLLNSYDLALSYLDRHRDKDPVTHLNCNWEICFELREYQRGRITDVRIMKVLDTP